MSEQSKSSEIPTFKEIDNWRWASKHHDQRVVYDYFKNLAHYLAWLTTDGEKLLEDKAPWPRGQFCHERDVVALLVRDAPTLKPANILLRLILKKGIASLRILADTGQIYQEEADLYLRDITFYLEAGAHCAMKVNDEDESEDSARMIDSLVPIAQYYRDEEMLNRISRCRFVNWGNELPRELYVNHFKNW